MSRGPQPVSLFFLPLAVPCRARTTVIIRIYGPLGFSSFENLGGEMISGKEQGLEGEEALRNLVEGGRLQRGDGWRDTSVKQPRMKSWYLEDTWENSHLPVAEKSRQEADFGGGVGGSKAK